MSDKTPADLISREAAIATVADKQMAEIMERQQRAYLVVSELRAGTRSWPEPDRDPDLLISASLRDISELLDIVIALRIKCSTYQEALKTALNAGASNIA